MSTKYSQIPSANSPAENILSHLLIISVFSEPSDSELLTSKYFRACFLRTTWWSLQKFITGLLLLSYSDFTNSPNSTFTENVSTWSTFCLVVVSIFFVLNDTGIFQRDRPVVLQNALTVGWPGGSSWLDSGDALFGRNAPEEKLCPSQGITSGETWHSVPCWWGQQITTVFLAGFLMFPSAGIMNTDTYYFINKRVTCISWLFLGNLHLYHMSRLLSWNKSVLPVHFPWMKWEIINRLIQTVVSVVMTTMENRTTKISSSFKFPKDCLTVSDMPKATGLGGYF